MTRDVTNVTQRVQSSTRLSYWHRHGWRTKARYVNPDARINELNIRISGKSASSRNIVKPKSRTESERTLTTRPVSRSKEILKTPDNPNERLAPFQDPLNPPTESSQPPSSSSTVISQAKSSQELNLASQLIPWLFMRHSIQETSIWAAHDAEVTAYQIVRSQKLTTSRHCLLILQKLSLPKKRKYHKIINAINLRESFKF